MTERPIDPTPHGVPPTPVSRRRFLAGAAGSGAAAAGTMALGTRDAAAQAGPPSSEDGPVRSRITVNGQAHDVTLDPRTTVLDWLREDLQLTGTKVGCNHGQCGACTVLLDGVRVNACFVLAASADGRTVTTIEGLAGSDGDLHPMQAAFVAHDGLQCGYCTPGQIVSAIGCVAEGHAGSDAEIREYMSGNLCRCGAYKGIVEAVREAREATERAGVAAAPEGRG